MPARSDPPELGSYLQRVTLRSTDLGVTLGVEAFLVDSYCTRIRFRLKDPPFPYTVASAHLVPQWAEDGALEHLRMLPPLPLVRIEPEPAQEEAAWMVFGRFPAEATSATLVVSRLQVPGSPHRPDIYVNPFLDPFDVEDDPGTAEVLEELAQCRRGHDYDLPPQWECDGCWTFRFSVGHRVPPSRVQVGAVVALGAFRLEVPWYDPGVTGTLVALDFAPDAYVQEWGEHWRARSASHLRRSPGPARLRSPVTARVKAMWTVTGGGEEEVSSGDCTGPHGLLQVRHYIELPPLPHLESLGLRVEELRGLPLLEAIQHPFTPASFEENATFELPLEPLGLDGTLTFTIKDVYEDAACFLVDYEFQVSSHGVAAVWPVAPTLVTDEGYSYVCQGDGTHPLESPTLGEPALLRHGMLFPQVDPRKPVTLNFGALDVALAEPLEVVLLESCSSLE